MRILFVTPYVPSLIRVRPYQLIRAMSQRQHEVSVLAVALGGSAVDANGLDQYCQQWEIARIPRSASLLSCIAAAAKGDPLQAAVCHTPTLDRHVADLLSRNQIDIVHIEHLRAARLVRQLPATMPRLFDAVDSISLLLERTLHSSHSMRQRAIALFELQRTRAFEARVLTEFDRTIVTSSDDAAALQRLAPSAPIHVVPNGVDQEYFRPLGEPREPATLIFSGKMSYHANVTAILHFVRTIMPLIQARRPDTRLWIVGSDPPETVRQLGHDPSILVTGHVADIRPYVGRATVAICPMVVKVGIQNKLLEAMAMATPAVATRIGAVGLSAEPGCDLLVGDNPREVAERVCELLANPERAAIVGEAGRSYVQRHHSWATAAQSLEPLYAEALAQRHQRGAAQLV